MEKYGQGRRRFALLATVSAALVLGSAALANQAFAICGGSGSCNSGPGVLAPATSITVPADDTTATNDRTPTFTFRSNRGNSSFWCRWASSSTEIWDDPSSFACGPETPVAADTDAPWTANWTFGPMAADGAKFLQVVACADIESEDGEGGTSTDTYCDQTPARRTITLDTAGPVAFFLSSSTPEGARTNGARFMWSGGESNGTYRCSFDTPTAFFTCGDNMTMGTQSEGPHALYVKAVDALGNEGPVVSRRYTSDNTPPVTTIDSGPAAFTNDTTPTFTYSATDADPGNLLFACRLDAGTASGVDTACPSTGHSGEYTAGTLTDGQYTFRVRARDTAVNWEPTHRTRTFVVDTQSPSIAFSADSASGTTEDSTPTFGLDVTNGDPQTTYRCQIDSDGFSACANPFTTRTLESGRHTVAMKAVDRAGNESNTVSRTITVAVPQQTSGGSTSQGGTTTQGGESTSATPTSSTPQIQAPSLQADTGAPALPSFSAGKQKVLKTKALTFTVACSEDCRLETVALSGRSKLGTVGTNLRTATPTKVTLRVSKPGLRVLKKALKKKKRASVVLRFTLADAVGNKGTVTKTVTVVR